MLAFSNAGVECHNAINTNSDLKGSSHEPAMPDQASTVQHAQKGHTL